MTKCFIILEFGKPFEWMDKFIEHVGSLGQYGWDFKIFTPNKHTSSANVGIVKMNIKQFNKLVKKKTGVKPTLHITKRGIPSHHITDYMIAYGKIFEDYLRCDFWGMMGGPDIVFGRLDHYLPDKTFRKIDIFTDDISGVNGCFTLCKNTEKINTLFKKIPNWKEIFTQGDCKSCITGKGRHALYGSDELIFPQVLKTTTLRIGRPKYYLLHGHDRLTNHDIEVKEDGSLWELNRDTDPPLWAYARPVFGREIMYYHFSQTKKWPII